MSKRQLSQTEIESIARAAHEVNRSYSQLIGDDSHKSWDEAPDWQKSSCRKGVIDVATNEFTPEQAHAAWMANKISEGWTYGETKNEAQKTHPAIVSYAALPEEQRYKDVLYTNTVKSLIDGLWRRPQ